MKSRYSFRYFFVKWKYNKLPRAATSVATRMVVEPLLNSLRTQSRSFCCLSPWIHIAGYPSRRMSRVNSSAFLWREKWKYERLSSFLACRQSYYFIFMALVVYISKYLLYIHKVVVCLVFMKILLNFFQNFFLLLS